MAGELRYNSNDALLYVESGPNQGSLVFNCCCLGAETQLYLLTPCAGSGTACNASSSIITETDFGSVLGKIVWINGKCYTVSEYNDADPSEGSVDWDLTTYDTCTACCDDHEPIYKLVPCVELLPCGCPAFVTVTISGVDTSCCEEGSNVFHKVDGHDPNGSYVLEATGLCGIYSFQESATGEYSQHVDSDVCSVGSVRTSGTVTNFLVEVGVFGGFSVLASVFGISGSMLEFFCIEAASWDCTTEESCLSSLCFEGGATVVPGDVDNPNIRCPGGDPIYTHTDLSADVGNVVVISGVCYEVSIDTDGNISDGSVTASSCASCGDCCDNDC